MNYESNKEEGEASLNGSDMTNGGYNENLT